MGEFNGNTPDQPLPKPLSTHVNTVAGFSHSCHALCNKLLQLFAEALEIAPDWFSSRHDQSKGASGSIMRLLYYPSIPDTLSPDEDDIRAGVSCATLSSSVLSESIVDRKWHKTGSQ
jgi:isopenicillin N synthase-like dioxygenase